MANLCGNAPMPASERDCTVGRGAIGTGCRAFAATAAAVATVAAAVGPTAPPPGGAAGARGRTRVSIGEDDVESSAFVDN